MDPINRIIRCFPEAFQAGASSLRDLLRTIKDLLKKADKSLTDLEQGLEMVVKYVPKKAGAWLPGSLFGVEVGFPTGTPLSQECRFISAFAAGCGKLAEGINWWMKAGRSYLVNDILIPAYREFADEKSDGIVSATMLGAAAGGLGMLAMTGPVGWGVGLGAAIGYGGYRGVRARRRTHTD